MRLEADLEQYFARRIKSLGGRSFKLAPTTAGIPDRLVLLPAGLIFLVELKTDDGKLSPIQQHWHAEIGKIGTRVYTLHGKAEIDSWVRNVLDAMYDEQDMRRRLARSNADLIS